MLQSTPLEKRQRQNKRRGWNNICIIYNSNPSVMLVRQLLREDGQWDFMSSVVRNCDESKISTYFPRHPISFTLHSKQQAICIVLHASQALTCLLLTTTSYHKTPAAQRGPEARPIVYPTLMALFRNWDFSSWAKHSPGVKFDMETWRPFSQTPQHQSRSDPPCISLHQSYSTST